jgi:hypothetical protein
MSTFTRTPQTWIQCASYREDRWWSVRIPNSPHRDTNGDTGEAPQISPFPDRWHTDAAPFDFQFDREWEVPFVKKKSSPIFSIFLINIIPSSLPLHPRKPSECVPALRTPRWKSRPPWRAVDTRGAPGPSRFRSARLAEPTIPHSKRLTLAASGCSGPWKRPAEQHIIQKKINGTIPSPCSGAPSSWSSLDLTPIAATWARGRHTSSSRPLSVDPL